MIHLLLLLEIKISHQSNISHIWEIFFTSVSSWSFFHTGVGGDEMTRPAPSRREVNPVQTSLTVRSRSQAPNQEKEPPASSGDVFLVETQEQLKENPWNHFLLLSDWLAAPACGLVWASALFPQGRREQGSDVDQPECLTSKVRLLSDLQSGSGHNNLL